MSIVKNQHYVPEFYLKLFSPDDNLIYAYDKVVKKSFPSSVSNVASAKYFYDFSPNPSGIDDIQVVEKGLSTIEGGCATVIKGFLTEVEQTSRFDLNIPERKVAVAYFIALQYCRTPHFRKMQSSLTDELAKTLNKKLGLSPQHLIGQAMRGEVHPLGASTPDEQSALEQADFIFNSDFINRVMPILMDHIWIIQDNQGIEPFYTSDSPVVLVSHKDKGIDGSAGFGTKGAEVILPLSSRYMLTLWERTQFASDLQQYEGTVRKMIPKWIQVYNGFQVSNSARQVYCVADKFEMIPPLMEKFPELADPDRPRFTIR